MGLKDHQDRPQIASVELPPDLILAVIEKCRREDLTASQIIRQALREKLRKEGYLI